MVDSFVATHCKVGDFILFHNLTPPHSQVGLITSINRTLVTTTPNLFSLDILVYHKFNRPFDQWEIFDDTPNVIGLNELQMPPTTSLPITISSNYIVDYAFVFSISMIKEGSICINGMSNAFFLIPIRQHITFSPSPSIPQYIFNALQNVLQANDKIMNNNRHLQCLRGKGQIQFHDNFFWNYIKFRLSKFPDLYIIGVKQEYRRRCNLSPSDMRRQTHSFVYEAETIKFNTDNGFTALRSIFGKNIGIGIRRRPPRVSEGSVPINHNQHNQLSQRKCQFCHHIKVH